MKHFTSIKNIFLAAGMLLACNTATAGDGTKASPYTPAELNAQKEALAASGDTVWVKADLKGLGEDGALTVNTENGCAALFGDATDTFVAYSWQILGELDLADLTNKKDLLIALTYQKGGQPYGNLQNPQYAENNKEPQDELHFSLIEVHNALSLTIDGLRGYHINACYEIPKKVIAVTVTAGYSSAKGAYVKYTNYDGATDGGYATPKNAAFVLMATKGTYDFVLATRLYDQTMTNSNSLNPGTQAGLNQANTKNRARYRFINTAEKPGFERNSQENCTVILESKDEVFLQVNSLATNFMGNYPFEDGNQNWISWAGGQYSDIHPVALFNFQNNNLDLPIGQAGDNESLHAGDMAGKNVKQRDVTLTVIDPENPTTPSRYFYIASKGNHLNLCKNASLKLQADEGRAIKGIEIVFQTSQKGMTADKGTYDEGTWTGNAEAVLLTASGVRYIYSISITTAEADAETQGIQTVTITEKNGRVGIYDLSGRRVTKPTKGIYIVDGKKVVIK